jgi:hypothetical protein
MTNQEYKKIGRILKEVYKELEEEAREIGLSLISDEFELAIVNARKLVLEKLGYTEEEYLAIKGKTADELAKTKHKIDNLQEELEQQKQKEIPTTEEIEGVAEQVADKVAQKYIKPPEVKIVNKIVERIKEPKIIKETVNITERVEYDETKIQEQIQNLYKRLDEIKIPEPVNLDAIKEDYHNYFSENFKKNINILGMPDFRKLAMGLQQQIDELKGPSSVDAAGNNTEIQFNNNGILGASSNLTFDGTNLGIGTTTPNSTLDVNGVVSINSSDFIYVPSSLTGSSFIGGGGKNATNTTGVQGFYNTFSGINAGQDITTGSYNAGFGFNAGANITTGQFNMYMGVNSGFTGNGGGNVGIGYNTLYQNTSSYNVAIGGLSLDAIDSSAGNVGIGYVALTELNGDGQNYNTAMGYAVGQFLTSGANNVLIGKFAARTTSGASNVTSLSYGVYIGTDVYPSATSGNSNEIVIGYQAVGNGSNTVTIGNDSITSTLLKGNVGIGGDPGSAKLYVNGNVGIGTTTPESKLHVLGTTEQLRLGYDASNYVSFTTASDGTMNISPVGDTFSISASQNLQEFKFVARNPFSGTGLQTSAVEVWGENKARFIGRNVNGSSAYFNMGWDSNAGASGWGYGASSVAVMANSYQKIYVGNSADKKFYGQHTISANAKGDVSSVITRRYSGTADLQQFQDENDTVLSVFNYLGRLGIGTSPSAFVHVLGTTEQLRLGYDASNYWSNTVDVSGNLNLSGSGGDFSVNTDDLFVDTNSGRIGIGTSDPAAKLDVYQSSTSAAVPVLKLNQADTDDVFINYAGTSAADQTKSISTVNGDGDVEGPKNYSSSAGWAFKGMVKIEVNGTAYWMPYYSADTS